ncbi:stage IV sporulation protein FB [Caloranaerobacter azorensis DSM 13643]|uniref:Stage IV sporulation protein FB n=2 Tax=Caloranaerobacter azorensis TaxID=116090 RepID=A0A1M5S9R7_9FIRM|nr:site-2 protease family protein [Caloranaerobacter azorensis]SHH35246.1 stage IV sporulation protein FB [Caloranaerobacter azorensis DSM 13643]
MTIFRIGQFKIKINYLLFVLFVLYFIIGYFIEVIVIFFSVLIHELAHVYLASKLDFKVDYIELFPFGGVAKLDGLIGTEPFNEIKIAVIGPIINFLLAFVLIFIKEYLFENQIIVLFIKTNMILAFINLLPLLPLDGGRIFRAILSLKLGTKRATLFVSKITYILSVIMIFIGILLFIRNAYGIYLILFFIFIIIAAKREKDMAVFIFLKQIICKRQKMAETGIYRVQHIVCLNDMKVKSVIENFIPNKYHIITVIDREGNVIDTLYEKRILEGVIKYGYDITIEKLLNKSEK